MMLCSTDATFIENPVCNSVIRDNIEEEGDQDEIADGSEQNSEKEQVLSTECSQRVGLLKAAHYVDNKTPKNGKKISQQIKGISYI